MGQIITVNFRNDTLFAVQRDDGEFVAITPICKSMGIDAQKQRRRIQEDPILSEGVCQAVYPSPGGDQEMTLLRLDLLNGWLFGINEKQVKDEETRQKVLTYKRECYAVLFNHFHGAKAQPRHLPDLEDMDAEEPELSRLRVVAEARLVWGIVVAREVWLAKNLIRTPSMSKPPQQPEFPFTYTAIRKDPEPNTGEAA
jgi:hypothetical protein